MGKIAGSVNEKIFRMIERGKAGNAGRIDRVENKSAWISCILHDTVYAEIHDTKIILGVYGGNWQTATTKQRINAIAKYYNLPEVKQKNFIWLWTDGVEYTGVREFQRIK